MKIPSGHFPATAVIVCLPLLILSGMARPSLYASVEETKKPSLTDSQDVTLETDSLSADFKEEVQHALREGLAKRGFFDAGKERKTGSETDKSKHNNRYRFRSSLEGKKVKVGEERISAYVIKEQKKNRYTLKVSVINTETGAVEKTYTRSAWSKEGLLKDAGHIAVNIADDFTVKTPEPVREKKVTELEPAKSEEKVLPSRGTDRGIDFQGFSLAGLYAMPLGDYGKLTGPGFGLQIGLLTSLKPYRNSRIILSLGALELSSSSSSVKSCRAAHAHLLFGYSVDLSPFSITPFAGGGYYLQSVEGDRDGANQIGEYKYKSSLYYNPAASAGMEIAFELSGTFHLFLAPEYTIFFEKGNQGHLLSISAGVRMNF